MADACYESGVYSRMGERTVRDDLRRDGWDPLVFIDPPGAVYPPHRHAETKLLAFLVGSMEVRAGEQTYRCLAGDRLIIPGGTEHAALVGPEGCTFFWSEQLRDVQ